ncbi:hypothetical protein FXO37_10333 [Capsicum annuum]|nr:hypothetical protein FXO37_10333 [Capsicum annuum]
MNSCKSMDTPIARGETLSLEMCPKTEKEKEDISSTIFQCSWEFDVRYNVYWPDICYAVGLGTADYSLCYSGSDLSIRGYTDVDWAGDWYDRKSTSVYAFLLNGGAISWKSKKQTCTALETKSTWSKILSEAKSRSAANSKELKTPAQDATEAELFACPICYEPLIRKGPSGFNVPAIYRSGFKCRKCNKSYSSKDIYLDLTVTSGTKQYNEVKPARSELFRSPVVSFLYERGWRQAFNRSGFPGPDEEVHMFDKLKMCNVLSNQLSPILLGLPLEQRKRWKRFKMAQEYFKVAEGGVLVDVSCGSGLFSRKFATSGAYSRVVALDFSENMLRQCYDFIKNDESIISSNLALVRADVSRLPFFSGSIDAVHAGAALHCWPSPSNALGGIPYICATAWAIWDPPLTRRPSPQPKFAARVRVSESATPQGRRQRGHGFKPWKQPLAEIQGKAAYDTPLWWGPSSDTTLSGSFSAPGCPIYM